MLKLCVKRSGTDFVLILMTPPPKSPTKSGEPALIIVKLSNKLAGTTSKAKALRSASVEGNNAPSR